MAASREIEASTREIGEREVRPPYFSGRGWLIAAGCAVLALAAIAYATYSWTRNGRELRRASEAGAASYSTGDFKTASSQLERAAELDPKNPATHLLLGQAYEAQGRLTEAERAYNASLVVKPDQPEVVYQLAIVHKAQGRTAQAVTELERAVSLNADFVGARLVLAELYARTGSKAKARAQYGWVLKKKPFGVDLETVRDKLEGL